jgi:hypothetical protein
VNLQRSVRRSKMPIGRVECFATFFFYFRKAFQIAIPMALIFFGDPVSHSATFALQ